MTDFWTAEDDAILEARARAKQAGDMASWPTRQEEHTCESGTSIKLHDTAESAEASGLSSGFCAEVVSTPGNPEVLMRASIGDRVRPGHEEDLDRVIAEVNREMALQEWRFSTPPPFEYVRDGDVVLLQARFCPDELTDEDRFWVSREFESTMMNVPDDEFGEHMEVVHVEGDCGCDACLAEDERNPTP